MVSYSALLVKGNTVYSQQKYISLGATAKAGSKITVRGVYVQRCCSNQRSAVTVVDAFCQCTVRTK